MMQKKSVHIRLIASLLLLCMLKVAFPVGEFFHNHHTSKELCAIATGSECKHEAHFSAIDTHHDCIFLQLHQFFAPSFFTYHLWEQSISTIFFFTYHLWEQTVSTVFFFIEKGIPQTAFAIFSRGPPVGLSMSQFAKLAN